MPQGIEGNKRKLVKPLKSEISVTLCINFQFVPHREHSVHHKKEQPVTLTSARNVLNTRIQIGQNAQILVLI